MLRGLGPMDCAPSGFELSVSVFSEFVIVAVGALMFSLAFPFDLDSSMPFGSSSTILSVAVFSEFVIVAAGALILFSLAFPFDLDTSMPFGFCIPSRKCQQK